MIFEISFKKQGGEKNVPGIQGLNPGRNWKSFSSNALKTVYKDQHL